MVFLNQTYCLYRNFVCFLQVYFWVLTSSFFGKRFRLLFYPAWISHIQAISKFLSFSVWYSGHYLSHACRDLVRKFCLAVKKVGSSNISLVGFSFLIWPELVLLRWHPSCFQRSCASYWKIWAWIYLALSSSNLYQGIPPVWKNWFMA